MIFKATSKPDFYSEKSILQIEKFIKWKQNEGSYNFISLPKKAIVSPISYPLSFFQKIIKKKIKGLQGVNYQINDGLLLSTGFGIGAPSVIAHLEELRALGVSEFIWLGYAGRLELSIDEATVFQVHTGFSLAGASFYYQPNERIFYESKSSNRLAQVFQLDHKTICSVDVPFRETTDLVNFMKQQGAELIDMETTAVLAFSQFYQLDATCFLIAADGFHGTDWVQPIDRRKLHSVFVKLVDKIVIHAHES